MVSAGLRPICLSWRGNGELRGLFLKIIKNTPLMSGAVGDAHVRARCRVFVEVAGGELRR